MDSNRVVVDTNIVFAALLRRESRLRETLLTDAGHTFYFPLGTWVEARRLCAGVDSKDTPFVTLTLHLDGRLWTGDTELQAGLRAKGFDRFFAP